MSRLQGRVLAVESLPQGSSAVEWTGTTLQVVDGSDFVREGGQFAVDGVVYDYAAVVEGDADGDPDVVTTVQSSPGGFVGEFRVDIYPPAVDVVAEVELLEASGSIPAVVPHALRPLLADGVRDLADCESVELVRVGQSWQVADVVGREASLDFYMPSRDTYPHTHIGGGVIETVRSDGESVYVGTSIGGTDADQMLLYDATGTPMAGFDSAGTGIAQSLSVAGNVSMFGRSLVDWLNDLPRGLVGRKELLTADFSTSPNWGTTELGTYEVQFDADALRTVRVEYAGVLQGTANSAHELRWRVEYSTSGTPAGPTISSRQLGSSFVTLNASGYGAVVFPTLIEVGVASSWRVLLTGRTLTSGADGKLGFGDTYPANITATDVGPYQQKTDGVRNTGGGTPYSGSTTAPAATAPKKSYVTTWDAAWLKSWRDGVAVTDYLQQGYYGGAQRYSMLGLNSAIATTLAGADVTKIELYIENMSWYYGSGGKYRISTHTATSAPASYTAGSDTFVTGTLPAGFKGWVTLPIAWAGGLKSTGTTRALTLGDGAGTDMTYYGKSRYATSAVKLRVSYNK